MVELMHVLPRCVFSSLLHLRGFYILSIFLSATFFMWYTNSPLGGAHHADLHDRMPLQEALLRLQHRFPTQQDANFSIYELNVSLSNTLPLLRAIPDVRPASCAGVEYDVDLPTISVVIPFHNEAWSMLLRTLNTIIFRTPRSILHEVILVDDASTYHYLQEPLDDYVSLLPNVKILRNKVREGLIRTRLKGAHIATGEVLVFLDAHVECNIGWAQPLLHAIKRNRSIIAVPHVDIIQPDTLEYVDWVPDVRGGFTWALDYIWREIPERVQRTRSSAADPIPTPTMIGCAMAIDKEYFFQMGSFDENMYIWGGENLELSFRTWLCGGAIYIYPCSRVAHVFRKFLPYVFPYRLSGKSIIMKNNERLAEVWMGEFKQYYYAAKKSIIKLTEKEVTSLQSRHQLRDDLKCKSFRWYLDNIAPEMFIPWTNMTYQGQLKNLVSWACLTVNTTDGLLYLSLCSLNIAEQNFYHSTDGRLFHNSTHCLAVERTGGRVMECRAKDASPGEQWYFNTSSTKHLKPGMHLRDRGNDLGRLELNKDVSHNVPYCLTQVSGLPAEQHQLGGLLKCNASVEFQYWSFSYRLNFTYAHGLD